MENINIYGKAFAEFYKNKNVLVTGISGFKGSWMLVVLNMLGANVSGFSLKPPTDPALFELIDGKKRCNFYEGDIRDLDALEKCFSETKPEIVIHMAAQPIVLESYKNPRYTFETNVMGTVNVLECVRKSETVKSFLNVTTDKVYENKEWAWGYRENEPLDGFDPYSNSKSCSELVTHSYKNSFFQGENLPKISTARAGNVIGGGDFADKRIIPDCVRAAEKGETIIVRNPYSTRPYQHVLEPVFAYLLIAKEQYENGEKAGWYNVGPDGCDCVTTGDIVDIWCKKYGENAKWENVSEKNAPHEANFLKLDCSKIKSTFGWAPRIHIEKAVELTADWTKVYFEKGDVAKVMAKQIAEYMEEN